MLCYIINVFFSHFFQTYFGCEYSGPGKSPLELLVDFYIELTSFGHPESAGIW